LSEIIRKTPEESFVNLISIYPYTEDLGDLFEDGLFLLDSLSYFGTDYNAAAYLLENIKRREIKISDPLVLKALHDIHTNIRQRGKLLPLKNILIELFDEIEVDVFSFLDSDYNDVSNEDCFEDIIDSFGYGPCTYLQTAVMAVRQKVFVGYILTMVKHMRKFTDITDLMGDVSIYIESVKAPEIEEHFGQIKQSYTDSVIGQFTKVSSSGWSLYLPDLGPFPDNLIYRNGGYQHAKSLIEKVFEAKVSIHTELSD